MFDKITEKHVFLTGSFKNPFVESVASDHTQLSTEGFLAIFHEGLFLPGITYVLDDFVCRFRTRSGMFAFEWLAVACPGLRVA